MATTALVAPNINDLVQTTLRWLGKPNYTELATDLANFPAVHNLLRKHKIIIQAGYGLQWDVMVDHTHSSRNVGLGANDILNNVDTMTQARAEWCNTTTSWSLIGQEISMNKEPARIVDMIQQRRNAALISKIVRMESNWWGPPVAVDDPITPWGINTWIPKTATEGFTVTVPTGFTTIGLNPTTYPRWKAWGAPYVAVTKDDLIRRMRKGSTRSDFMPPVDGLPTFNTGDTMGWYTNYGVIGPMEELLESQNENLGNDLAKMDGRAYFRRSPMNWVASLEPDTTNPVYGINWGVVKTVVLNGWWDREVNIPVYPGQHTVAAHFLDSTYQWVFFNRRQGNQIYATGTTYPS